jgi:DNA-binding LacI/PurR family transcriptional regulator
MILKMKRIRHGMGSHPNGAVTIKDVAVEAGVSTATVSRVLTGPGKVGKHTQDHVLRAVKKLDYHPNHLARDLRAGLRKVIGVIIPDLQNPFCTRVVSGVEAVLYSVGYTLVLGHSDGLVGREQKHFDVLKSEGAAGLILIPGNGVGADYGSLRAWNMPVVAVDRMPSGLQVDLVGANNRQGVREAVNHLLSHGYKDIALIGGPPELSVARERHAGYQEALKSAGITPRESLVIHGDFRQEGGWAAMNRFLDMPKPPRAVLVANNLMTLGALQAIHERGICIPDEIAIVGFDDMPWATSLRPPLTVVAQPTEEFGRLAAEMLLERLKDPKRTVRRVILPTRLIIRASCGVHPHRQSRHSKNQKPAKTNLGQLETKAKTAHFQ